MNSLQQGIIKDGEKCYQCVNFFIFEKDSENIKYFCVLDKENRKLYETGKYVDVNDCKFFVSNNANLIKRDFGVCLNCARFQKEKYNLRFYCQEEDKFTLDAILSKVNFFIRNDCACQMEHLVSESNKAELIKKLNDKYEDLFEKIVLIEKIRVLFMDYVYVKISDFYDGIKIRFVAANNIKDIFDDIRDNGKKIGLKRKRKIWEIVKNRFSKFVSDLSTKENYFMIRKENATEYSLKYLLQREKNLKKIYYAALSESIKK